MPEIPGGIQRYQAEDFRQFTLTTTPVRPTTVSYVLYDPNGASLALSSISPVNSGVTVQESAVSGVNSTGLFHIEYTIPATLGFYIGEWKAFNTASQAAIIRHEFEIYRTEPRSFLSYGNVADVLRTARVLFKAYEFTARDIQDYMEPADDRINAMLANVMTVPVTPNMPILRDCVKAMALWGIYTDKFAEVKRDAPPGIYSHYKSCMEFFAEVMSGNAILVTDSGAIVLPTGLASTTQDYKPIFDLRPFEDMRPDPDVISFNVDEDED